MKKTAKLFSAITIVAMAMATNTYADTKGITVNVNGNVLQCGDVPAQIINNRTMVPMRAIFEALDVKIDWDSETKTVIADNNSTHIEMTIGAGIFTKNNQSISLDTPAQVIDGRTLVPVRAVSEALDCNVDWNSETKTVSITSNEQKQEKEEKKTDTDYETVAKSHMRPKPIVIENEKYYNYHCGTRYIFEQKILVNYLNENAEICADAIKDSNKFNELIKEIWDENKNTIIVDYMVSDPDDTYVIELDENSNVEGELYKLIEEVTEKFKLSFEDNIATATLQTDTDYIGLISVAYDGDFANCAYIAVMYNKNDGFRVYTAEYDDFLKPVYMMCYVGVDSRVNLNSSLSETEVETPEIFLKNIIEIDRTFNGSAKNVERT